MRCINCGIAMLRIHRHLISSLSEHYQRRLSRWITNDQTQLPPDTFICHPCFLLLNSEAGEHGRLLGHNMVCLGCGRSVRKIRHHNVSMECPLLANLLTKNTNYMLSRSNYVCHVCSMRANRHAVLDSSRDIQELATDSNVAAPNVQMVRSPEPPPLTPVQSVPLRRESNTIFLPNFKRASSTSTHCIFQSCRNIMLHLVPKFLKRLILQYNTTIIIECLLKTYVYEKLVLVFVCGLVMVKAVIYVIT